jgi:hypothetical protein
MAFDSNHRYVIDNTAINSSELPVLHEIALTIVSHDPGTTTGDCSEDQTFGRFGLPLTCLLIICTRSRGGSRHVVSGLFCCPYVTIE